MKKTILFTAALILLILTFNTNIFAQADCSKTSDAGIVRSINRKLAQDRRIINQMNNIRIISRNKVVTISGNVKGKGVKQAVTRRISEIYCVDQIVNKLNGVTVNACTQCQYLCNGACIDRCAPCDRKAQRPKKPKSCPVCPGDSR